MRAPAEHVVTRHLLHHPEDTPAELSRHCNLHYTTARQALRRLQAQGITDHPEGLFAHLQSIVERPRHKTFRFQAPNPEQFLAALSVRYWLSGEAAAAADGFDIIPERITAYVGEGSGQAIETAVRDSFAKIAPAQKANVIIKIADPWLHLDPDDPLVERGQRLLDYRSSKHLQLLRSLPDA